MRPQLTDLSYSSWFVNLDPVTIEGDSFVIVTPNELNKSTLTIFIFRSYPALFQALRDVSLRYC